MAHEVGELDAVDALHLAVVANDVLEAHVAVPVDHQAGSDSAIDDGARTLRAIRDAALQPRMDSRGKQLGDALLGGLEVLVHDLEEGVGSRQLGLFGREPVLGVERGQDGRGFLQVVRTERAPLELLEERRTGREPDHDDGVLHDFAVAVDGERAVGQPNDGDDTDVDVRRKPAVEPDLRVAPRATDVDGAVVEESPEPDRLLHLVGAVACEEHGTDVGLHHLHGAGAPEGLGPGEARDQLGQRHADLDLVGRVFVHGSGLVGGGRAGHSRMLPAARAGRDRSNTRDSEGRRRCGATVPHAGALHERHAGRTPRGNP